MQHLKIPFHATVLSKDNHGIILMGKSGSGKTSLAYCLLENNWNLITDSTCSVFKSENIFFVESESAAKILYFKFPTLFPELNNHEFGFEEFSPKHQEIRLIMDSNLIFPGNVQDKSDISLFIFPQLTEQKKSQLFELSVGEAVAIFRQDAWNLHHEKYDFTDEDEVFMRQMFERIKCFRLNIGRDWRFFMDEVFELQTIVKTEILLK